jgi:tRNA C32,U32 (ribose-2'-O)-methylase TrmJ
MVTITLELTDEQVKSLTEDAEQQGLTIQELALLRVLFVHSPAEPGSSMNYESAVEYVFYNNSELYDRLAGREERISAAIKRIIDKNEELYRRLA